MTDVTVECPECGNAMNARYDAGRTDKLHGFDCPECQVFTQPNGLQTTEYSDSDGEQLKQKTRTIEQSEDQSMTDLTETETVTDYETTEVEREMFNCPVCPHLNQDPRHPLEDAGVPLALDPDTSQHFGSGPEREFDDAKAIAYVCETCADAVFDYDGLSHRGHGRKRDHLKAAVTDALAADDDPTRFADLNMTRYLALCAGACTVASWFGWYIGAKHGVPLKVATVYLMALWIAVGLAALYKGV